MTAWWSVKHYTNVLYSYAIVPMEKGFSVYNIKTTEVVCKVDDPSGTGIPEGGFNLCAAACDENFVVICFYTQQQTRCPSSIAIWTWKGMHCMFVIFWLTAKIIVDLLRQIIVPIRVKVLESFEHNDKFGFGNQSAVAFR